MWPLAGWAAANRCRSAAAAVPLSLAPPLSMFCTASVLPLYCLCTAHPPGAEEHETVDDAQGARQRGTLLAAARRCCSRRCRRGCYSCCHGCRWRSSGGGTDSACSQLLLNDCADEGWDVAVGQAGALQGGGQAGAAGAGLHRLPQSAHPFFHHGGVAGGLGGLLRVGGRRRPAAGRGIRAGGQQAAAAAGGGRGGQPAGGSAAGGSAAGGSAAAGSARHVAGKPRSCYAHQHKQRRCSVQEAQVSSGSLFKLAGLLHTAVPQLFINPSYCAAHLNRSTEAGMSADGRGKLGVAPWLPCRLPEGHKCAVECQ